MTSQANDRSTQGHTQLTQQYSTVTKGGKRPTLRGLTMKSSTRSFKSGIESRDATNLTGKHDDRSEHWEKQMPVNKL